MNVPVGLSLDEARALALATDPWWDTMLAQLPVRCPTCGRSVLPAAHEPKNPYGLGAQVGVAWIQREAKRWLVIACCGRVLAEGYRLSAPEDPRR